jgi:membrane-associated phospholipid phosphatase
MSWGSLDIARKQERNKAVVISAILFIAFLLVTEQVMTKSYIYRLDHKIEALKHHTFRGLSSHFLLALDDLGLRSLTATCLLLTAAVIAYRFRSWRPINLSVAALLLLNGVVGLSKLIFGRTKPRLNMDYLHQGGLSYPSGHASNALLTWGMLAYLVHTYTNRKPFKGIRLYWLVGVITATVCVVSLIRKTHWFSDLLGGLFLGGSLLIFLVALDRAWPSKRQPE